MKKLPLWPFFLIGLLFTFCSTALIPNYRFLSFAPFLIIAFNRLSLPKTLYLACICGLITDLLSSQHLWGFHMLNHVVTLFFLYLFRFLFVEKIFGLFLLVIFFSFFATIIGWVTLLFFETSFPTTWEGIKSDLLIMPFLDGCYALLCFLFSLLVYNYIPFRRFCFLFFRKEVKKERNNSRG